MVRGQKGRKSGYWIDCDTPGIGTEKSASDTQAFTQG